MTNLEFMQQADTETVADIMVMNEYCEECKHIRNTGSCDVVENTDVSQYHACIEACKNWLKKERKTE